MVHHTQQEARLGLAAEGSPQRRHSTPFATSWGSSLTRFLHRILFLSMSRREVIALLCRRYWIHAGLEQVPPPRPLEGRGVELVELIYQR